MYATALLLYDTLSLFRVYMREGDFARQPTASHSAFAVAHPVITPVEHLVLSTSHVHIFALARNAHVY